MPLYCSLPSTIVNASNIIVWHLKASLTLRGQLDGSSSYSLDAEASLVAVPVEDFAADLAGTVLVAVTSWK